MVPRNSSAAAAGNRSCHALPLGREQYFVLQAKRVWCAPRNQAGRDVSAYIYIRSRWALHGLPLAACDCGLSQTSADIIRVLARRYSPDA